MPLDDLIEKRLFRPMALIRWAVWRPVLDRDLRHITLLSMESLMFSIFIGECLMPAVASQCRSLPLRLDLTSINGDAYGQQASLENRLHNNCRN
jgi:hypothetical protein